MKIRSPDFSFTNVRPAARLRMVFSSSGRLVMERIKQVGCLAVSNLRVIDGLGSTLLELLLAEVKN